ncbi:putative bis(5'-adenosyl)-triphosphatase [Rosa chinensis]|uniref:Putative bis(5'-adenosyl)-triphosphatase n=1 Tax=Rosa chinensis TaxID=74649 RepID=A0A2P6SGT2_ROSCH|nr:putative bis(5'-adenosyl)-triphosphatase [Rosa chinensis]
MALESHTFGSYKIDSREVFYDTNLSYALVNLRSVVSECQKVGSRLESYHKATSLTLMIQVSSQGLLINKFDFFFLLFDLVFSQLFCSGYLLLKSLVD